MTGKIWKIENWRSELDLLISVKEEVQRCTVNKEPEGQPRRDGRPFYQPEPSRSFPVASQYKTLVCSLCQEGGHFPSECTKYGNTQARRDRLLEQNRCLNCLRDDHRAFDCPNHRRCSKCQGRHHFLVCFSRDGRNRTQPKFVGPTQRTFCQPNRFEPVAKHRQSTQSIWETRDEPHCMDQEANYNDKLPLPKENSVVATAMDAKNKPTAYLMTKRLMVNARGRKERIPVYVFFDTGSQTSFVSRRLVEKLNPPRGREIDQLEIHGFGGASSNPLKIRSPTYMIKIQKTDGNWEEIALNCTEEIATPFDMINFDEYFYNRTGVDSLEIVKEKPDIMIGIKQFCKFFISKEKEILPGLYSIQTVFGTMTAGETNFGQNSEKKSMSLVAVHVSNNKPLPMPDAVEDFRSMESPVQNHAEVEANLNQCPI
uniref:CCHC-type domain-containing protein n=1 Tax=Meloidogyne incognita TaxID=6306 RepID=A0A914LPS1_MELIC